jgi:hypothetical protein
MEEDTVSPVECISCSTELDPDNAYTVDGEIRCDSCIKICERCDEIHSEDDDFNLIDDSECWCQSCTESYANWCDSCSEYYTGYTTYAEDRSGSYCESCADNYLSYCDNCDNYYANGCTDCNEDEERVVHDYSYRPDAIFHRTKDDDRLFFGIEIECEAPRGDWDKRREASEYAYAKLEPADLAYLKNDGSLNCGFEIVTHPMTHEFFMTQADTFWNTLEVLRTQYSMRSWSTTTCGLHIHISRAGFSGGAHTHRFLQLVYQNEEFYSRLAGRSSSNWAKFDDVMVYNSTKQEYERSFARKLSSRRDSDRYSAVNTNNRATLEMRIFRGSVNSSNVKSALDLAHASVEYTRNLTVPQVREGALGRMNFIQYLHDNKDKYPHLLSRMDRLFITSDSE